jgi:uncharacterized membrane protein YesL
MKGLTVAADLLLLNIITAILCLPVFTIGPALTALNDIVIRLVRGEEGYIVRPYFQAFKLNFKRGVLFSLILIPAAGILYVDYLFAEALIPILKPGIVALGVIVLVLFFYIFALQARYENTFGGTIKNAAILAIGNFPRTLLMAICAIGLWVVCINFYQIGYPVLLLFGISLPCYVNILLLNGVFRKLDGDDKKEEEESELPYTSYVSYDFEEDESEDFDEADEADDEDADAEEQEDPEQAETAEDSSR